MKPEIMFRITNAIWGGKIENLKILKKSITVNGRPFNLGNVKKNRPVFVVGQCSEPKTVQGVENLSSSHVLRLGPSITIENLSAFLSKKFNNVKSGPLKSRFPETYASFKVILPVSEFEKELAANNWPKMQLSIFSTRTEK